MRILCARETQKSIADSVHYLLATQIDKLGLSGFYRILKSEITGANGTTFISAGIRQNISNINSYESVDICWVEEAANVSKSSWDVLIPTIRKPGSEIWVSFNSELESERFVLNPPPGAVLVTTSWCDNPALSDGKCCVFGTDAEFVVGRSRNSCSSPSRARKTQACPCRSRRVIPST